MVVVQPNNGGGALKTPFTEVEDAAHLILGSLYLLGHTYTRDDRADGSVRIHANGTFITIKEVDHG